MNRLENLTEFQKVLKNYQVSAASKAVLKGVDLVLLVAPSSMGRNTIIRELLKLGRYHFIVSDTTRQPRTNDGVIEQDGVEYWFRSEADVLEDLKNGEFLEAALIHNQQVSGMSIREIKKARSEKRIAINEVEITGAENVHKAYPEALIIFVLPPSFKEWQRRLDGRGPMSSEERRRRLQSALKEFEAAATHDYYHFVINDDLQTATQEIDQLATHQRPTNGNRSDFKQLLSELCRDTRTALEQD